MPNWRYIIADARPALLIGDSRLRETAEQLLAHPLLRNVPWLDLDADLPDMLRRDGGAPVRRAPVHPEDPQLVLYTSGTTGRPKGAVLPRRQLFYNAVATITSWELSSADVAPLSTPLFHTGGWNVFSTPLWQAGGTVVLFDRFEPGDFLAGLAEERCTVAFGVPTQFLMMLEHPRWGEPLPALRGLLSGGAPCPASVSARIRAAGYPFREGFGLTECGPNCFAITNDEAVRRPGSVGWPIAFLDMRLVDEQLTDVPEGEVGELLLRGPQLFGGYLHDPERTAEALTPDGWLRTGDLARRDDDGGFHIAGRRKEMYISGGENVYPAEVEAVLADCPGVGEVAVVGVPDARWGEVGCAVVAPRADASDGPAEEQLLAFARERLARYKVPRRVVMTDALPRLGSGKLDRRRLAELARGTDEATATAAREG